MLVDIHMLKSFPPTNLNRDETGNPKTCFFGGSQRGRISSQSLKRAWRKSIFFSSFPLGVRTRHLPSLVADELRKDGIQEDFVKIAMKLLTELGKRGNNHGEDENVENVSKSKKLQNQDQELNTSQIMFFSPDDIQAVTEVVKSTINKTSLEKFSKFNIDNWQKALNKRPYRVTLDMALFGRMITDISFRDVEASLQVAHAISTHIVVMESDFFTAVDDDNKYRKDAHSAMMGGTDFNACCYYFYASLDVDQLVRNTENSPDVRDILSKVLPALMEALCHVNPTGKQNTFAGHSEPGLMLVERKARNIPVSYANAYETPVRGTSGTGLMQPSIAQLARFVDNFDASFGLPVMDRLWFCPADTSDIPANATRVASLGELCEIVGKWI